MGRKAFCCCSLRVGVIFIGALSIVFSVLLLGALCVLANSLTATVLRSATRPAVLHPTAAPTLNPDAEFIRVPRRAATGDLWTLPDRALDHTIEHYTRLLLQNMDSSRLTDEGNRKTRNQDDSDVNDRQSETMKKNESINGSEASNSDGRRQVEVTTQEVEMDTRSSQKDRFAESSTESNTVGKQPGEDENSANSFGSPQRTSKPPNMQSSTEMTSYPDSIDMSGENAFVGRRINGASTGRELEEEGNIDDKNWKENKESPICGGPELEEMLWKISFLSAYEAVEQTREVAGRSLGAAALGAAMFVAGLFSLTLAGIAEVLHFGAGVMLIVGAVKGRAELLRPWRLLALASWAVSVGGNVVSLAAAYPLRSLDPSKVMTDAAAVVVLIVYIGVYAYCYSVVLKLENELQKKKQTKEQDSNESVDKEHSNIYSCRF